MVHPPGLPLRLWLDDGPPSLELDHLGSAPPRCRGRTRGCGPTVGHGSEEPRSLAVAPATRQQPRVAIPHALHDGHHPSGAEAPDLRCPSKRIKPRDPVTLHAASRATVSARRVPAAGPPAGRRPSAPTPHYAAKTAVRTPLSSPRSQPYLRPCLHTACPAPSPRPGLQSNPHFQAISRPE